MKNLDCFLDSTVLETSLARTREEYRPFDPGSYLYHQVLGWNADDKFTRDFIELVYVTLAAWNMNSRGARLSDFKTFSSSLITQRTVMEKLGSFKLGSLEKPEIQETLKKLFFDLVLVDQGKPPLVTFSKTLHFFFPELIGPIDRTYTLRFFYGHTNIPSSLDAQYRRFIDIELEFARFAGTVSLAGYKDLVWNTNVPKIIDNAIIGWMKGQANPKIVSQGKTPIPRRSNLNRFS